MKLREAEIETHAACNARCRYCVYPAIKDGLGRETLSRERFLDILHGLAFARDDLVNIHLHHVNEPLLFPDLPWFVARAREAFPRARTGFSTNAILLSPQKAEAALKAGLNLIYLTVPSGQPETYKRVMGIDADIARTLANIRTFLSLAGEEVRVVARSPLGFDGRLQAFYADFPRVELEAIPISSRLGRIDPETSPDLRQPPSGGRPSPCALSWVAGTLIILRNGDVPLCCNDQEHRFIVGNVFERGVEALWTSPRFEQVRAFMAARAPRPADFPCDACEYGLKEGA